MFSDPTGQLWQGAIHNDVVNRIQALNVPPGMMKNKRVDFPHLPRGRNGKMLYGYVDLFNPDVKEMWEVKRCNLSLTDARAQLKLYTQGRLHDPKYSNITGWKTGRDLAPGSFIENNGFEKYYIEYWSVPNTGIIFYDYWQVTDWDKVKQAGLVIIGGVAFVISVALGAPQPQLLPV